MSMSSSARSRFSADARSRRVAFNARLFTLLLSFTALVLAGGGFVIVDLTRVVSSATTAKRWEPSSAAGATWLHSWNDINDATFSYPGFTSSWDGFLSLWRTPFEHRTPTNGQVGDINLAWDPTRNNGRFVLVMQDVNFPISVFFRSSTDSTGAAWNAPVAVFTATSNVSYDYPSIAVTSSGQIAIGASQITGGGNSGYYVKVSDDGGVTWRGPYTVLSTGGGVSRLTASGNVYHAFYLDRFVPVGNPPVTSHILKRSQSTNGGVTWSNSVTIQTYGSPLYVSPSTYLDAQTPPPTCPNLNAPCPCTPGTSGCAYVHYMGEPDVAGSSGLGWVVAYPVNDNGKNSLNVCTELAGCVTINHVTDLFMSGVTTSARGDWWLQYATYMGGANRNLPLQQGVVYRTNSGSYLGATIETNINPKAWRFLTNGGFRCQSQPCFSAGDYFHPASNTYTGASIPLVREQQTYQTELRQISFVILKKDPMYRSSFPKSNPFHLA